MYTNEEYCEMVSFRKHPSYCTIDRDVQRLYKTGSCQRRIPLSRATPSSLRISSENVLGYVLAYPESSVRDISRACSYSKSTVFLKGKVYERESTSKSDLLNRISMACRSVTPTMLQMLQAEFLTRVWYCISGR
ncbi:DUF4817 domain-containing protein [Trichonephila clavipes]|nr:DUF4817 domain-containing protein [Trichonephila clavipes]